MYFSINLYISCILNPWYRDLNTNFTLGNYLFGDVELTKSAGPVKYAYSSYGIGFDARSKFSLLDGSFSKYVIIFGAENSSSVHVGNKDNNILILVEGWHKD